MEIRQIRNSVRCKLRTNLEEIKDEMTLSSDSLKKSRLKQKSCLFLAFLVNMCYFCSEVCHLMEQKQVLNNIRRVARTTLPPNSKLLLYGSRARGDARPDSDWDLLILLDKDKITSIDIDEISYPMRELGWQINEIVNPIMYTLKEWKSKSYTPFYKNVMKEGIAL